MFTVLTFDTPVKVSVNTVITVLLIVKTNTASKQPPPPTPSASASLTKLLLKLPSLPRRRPVQLTLHRTNPACSLHPRLMPAHVSTLHRAPTAAFPPLIPTLSFGLGCGLAPTRRPWATMPQHGALGVETAHLVNGRESPLNLVPLVKASCSLST